MLIYKKLWISFFIVFSQCSFAQNHDKYTFDTKILYDDGHERIYLVVEKTGYLKNVGIETAVNTLLIEKRDGLLVIDPGPHKGYLEKIISTVNDNHQLILPPAKWVFNSSAKPENVMGNYALQKSNPTYISSPATAKYMSRNCEACRDDMLKEISSSELSGSEIIIPTYMTTHGSMLHPKFLDWRVISFSCFKETGETLLWNEKAGILYAGGAIFNGSLPSLAKSHIVPLIQALEVLRKLNIKQVVGTGTVTSFDDFKKSAITRNLDYLSLLYRTVKQNYLSSVFRLNNRSIYPFQEFRYLRGFEKRHDLNYQKALHDIELESFDQMKTCSPLMVELFKKKPSQYFKGDLGNSVPLEFEKISPGLFSFQGLIEEFSTKNNGLVSNFSFIMGDNCIAVIDTGGSFIAGKSFIAAIKKISSKPICFVINTHAHPDHTGGNKAFKQLSPSPEFIAHKNFTPAHVNRIEIYNKRLFELMGKKDTLEPYVATKEVEGVLQIDLGDRKLSLTAWDTAHTNHDLTVFDHKSGALIAGDLLFVEHIPVIDGSLNGWIEVTNELIGLFERRANKQFVETVIPGHGPPQEDDKGLKNQLMYLMDLKKAVKGALRDNISLQEAMKTIDLKSAKIWRNGDDYSRRNISAAYAELEWED